MPVANPLDFSSASAAEGALKKIKQWMIRAGQPVVATEFMDKPKRSNSVTYREATLTLASGQLITLRVIATGDIFQAVLNKSVVPIKNHDDMAKAVAELARAAESNQAAFQKAQARIKVALPPGLSTPKPKMAQALQERVSALDAQIAERKATVADLQQQLGVMIDSIGAPSPQQVHLQAAVKPLATTYIEARDLVAEKPEMLDSAATEGAGSVLRAALSATEAGHQVSLEYGDLPLAALQQHSAEAYRLALGMLDSAPTAISDAGLAELVAIAAVSAAEADAIDDQNALAELLALGMVEVESGLYLITPTGVTALDEAGYDSFGEPYAAAD
ncbi:hypothetical protein ACQKO6_17800 [Pseudomonas monteilii]